MTEYGQPTRWLKYFVLALVFNKFNKNKKYYVLWNAGICPVAEIVRNTTFENIKTHDRYQEYTYG